MIIKLLREGLGRLIVLVNYLTLPSKLVRSEEQQIQVNERANTLSLYQFYACPFCVKTRRAIHKLNVPIEIRDAQKNQQHRQALLEGGGKIKVPCLRIEDNNKITWVYESNEIITYLTTQFEATASQGSSSIQ